MNSIFPVQPSRNKKFGVYRLGLDRATSDVVKKHEIIELLLERGVRLKVKIVCGPPNKKNYDVNHQELNTWIKRNGFEKYPHGKPTKLLFQFDVLKRSARFIKKLNQS
jgi:hypothetical protein